MHLLRIVRYRGTQVPQRTMYECIVGEVFCPGSQVWRYGQSLHDILYFIGADDGKTADMEFDPINLARERAAFHYY